MAEVEKASPVVGAALKPGASLVALSEGEVRLRFPEGTHFASFVERKRAEVEAAFTRFFGRPTRLVIETGPAPEAPPAGGPASIAAVEQAEKEARASAVREAARGHTNIQEAARVLGADVGKIEEL